MAGSTANSLTVSRCDTGTDSFRLDPSSQDICSPDMSAAVVGTEAQSGTVDGLCSTVSTGDVEPLPASCVVEDDEALPTHGRHHYHYRRHRSSSRRRRRCCRVKWKEVNFIAAMLNIVAAVLVCTALAEPRWWYIGSSPCMNHDRSASYLGVKQFFYKGFFVERSSYTSEETSKYYYGTLQTEGWYCMLAFLWLN